MFHYDELPFTTPLERVPNALPIRILMALPDYVTEHPNPPIFDLTAAISTILRATDWDGATQVFQPHYWAPGWIDADFRALPHPYHGGAPGDLPVARLDVFPIRVQNEYTIVHFTGGLTNAAGGGVEMDLGAGNHISTPQLADTLQQRKTRLLILQLLPSETFTMAVDLANTLVGREIPAVLVAQGHDRVEINEFFLRMYYNISHDLPLVDAVAQTGIEYLPSIQAQLVACTNASNVLRLRDYRDMMRARLIDASTEARRLRDELHPIYDELTDGGRHSTDEIEDLFSQTDNSLSITEQDAQRVRANLENIPERWDHETEGVIPLSQIARETQAIEQRVEDLAAQNRALHRRAREERDDLRDRYGRPPTRGVESTPSGPPREAAVGPPPRMSDDQEAALPELPEEWLGDDDDEPVGAAPPSPPWPDVSPPGFPPAAWLGDDADTGVGSAPPSPSWPGADADASLPQGSVEWLDDDGGADWGPLPAAPPLPDDLEDVVEGEFRDDDDFIRESMTEPRPSPTPQPRVLNANFAEVGGTPLAAQEALTAGETYDLRVDVGLRREESIVTPSFEAFFPFQALPPELDGYVVDVIFVSDDFSPSMISTQMWVPRLEGRSAPVVDGQPQSPGPVSLRLSAPQGQIAGRAYGRLNLYYENNLLQSALVNAAVSAQPRVQLPDAERLRIDVDYVLTATYEDLRALETRHVHFDAEDDPGEHPVRVNLTMNSNGDGGHRIVVKGTATTPSPCALAGHTPYDPLANSTILNVARDTLFDCYFERDAAGRVTDAQREQAPAFDKENGKTRESFKRDLWMLAIQGSKLFTLAFADVKMEGAGCTPVQWQRNLLSALKDSSIIQVTRMSSASYVFPWALVYEHPLIDAERSEWDVCKIVNEEWAADGTRQPTADQTRSRCKYHDEPWHAKNVLCPYGFWGLKHIIEEPQSIGGSSSVADVGRRVHYADKLDVAVSITQDASMVDKITTHLDKLAQLQDIRYVSAQPATGWKALRPNLKAPEIVYFLCHGESDGADAINSAYLSIGPRDNDPDHRIYAVGTLGGWIIDTVDGPDPDAWAQRRPLVFINGCHTNGLQPGYIVSFASMFASLGACGVLGTEVRVPLPVATEVAERFFELIAPPQPVTVGQALRQIRWELVNKGNLLGLAYSLYGLADLQVETDG